MATKEHVRTTQRTKTNNSCGPSYIICSPVYSFTLLELVLCVVCSILLVFTIERLISIWRQKQRCRTKTETNDVTSLEFSDRFNTCGSSSFDNVNTAFDETQSLSIVDEHIGTTLNQSVSTQTEPQNTGPICTCGDSDRDRDSDAAKSNKVRNMPLLRGSKGLTKRQGSTDSEDFELQRCSSCEGYQIVDYNSDSEYVAILAPPNYGGNDLHDPPEYLQIFRSMDVDEEEYVKPLDEDELPPFPEHCADITGDTYNPELPKPPQKLETLAKATEQDNGQSHDLIKNDVPSQNKDESTDETANNVAAQKHAMDEDGYLDMSKSIRKTVKPQCFLSSQVDHDEEIEPDGTSVYDSLPTTIYSVPNKYKREDTKQIIKQLLMNCTNGKGVDSSRDNNVTDHVTNQTLTFPKHKTLPARTSNDNHGDYDAELTREGKPRAVTFDEEYLKNTDTTKVSSFLKSLEDQDQTEQDEEDTNYLYEECDPQSEYEMIDSRPEESTKDENENVLLRPPSSIYENVRDPLYDFVEKEVSSCDICEEQPCKDDEVSRAVVRRKPSPFLTRKDLS